MHNFLCMIFCLLWLQRGFASDVTANAVYFGSRESDPASLVENVSTIYGDYSEVEVDLVVPAPDSLVLSRFYTSRDVLETATFGGWRFNPHCFLSMEKAPKAKTDAAIERKSECIYAHVGNPDGSILTYIGWKNITNPTERILFYIDPEQGSVGLANTAKGTISSWTNLKNNELYFDPQTDSFELQLCSQGKRFYHKHLSTELYVISYEILPSGNKVFYEFDEKCQLTLIKETNASEAKVLAWIKILYEDGIHITTSDGKTADYHFQEDAAGVHLLTEVIRSDKPNLNYQYQLVDNRALLTKKSLPEGRFVQVDYYTEQEDQYKVKSISTPSSQDETSIVQFSYGDHYTEVNGLGDRKTLYRFDDALQLIAIEQYLDDSLYRVHRKAWGERSDAGNLISTSLEDSSGKIFHYKHYVYDKKIGGHVVEEREYGDIACTGSIPLIIDEEGMADQDGQIKYYSYFSGKTTHGFFHRDAKGAGVKYWYKNGTNLLIKKFVLTKGSPNVEEEGSNSWISQRHFYTYNEDAVLTRVVVEDVSYTNPERLITDITPKQAIPNVGAPEIVEQKYGLHRGEGEGLLKRTVNQFNDQGNIVSQSLYDANGIHCYTIAKKYEHGLLIFETDPIGNEKIYCHDANRNLISEAHSDTGIFVEYGYDLRNRCIRTVERDRAGNQFETQASYDSLGNKLAEMDRFGNETLYAYDSLGRAVSITYPAATDGSYSSFKPTYRYVYDLFDNQTSVTDPKGRVLSKTYTVHGKPSHIYQFDGTQEIFRYDSGGNLYYYHGRDGLVQVFKYDFMGRTVGIDYYDKGSSDSFKSESCIHLGLHKAEETDAKGKKTYYTYDPAGRLAILEKENQKVEFIYDSLGRTHGVKKWTSSSTFTLEIEEYDLMDRVVEERTEGV